ncbi:hypothetical protein NQ176_g8138 [Zarea fungicola]|uniref:Uncharacterized protein n=1 Tax=Zarea fungicola TaxID=93591 RepID=A0ACC1MWH6_9HYPO|nr:hypothetical protein NQ176_g8138 [Lecanicillium fungicola]
MPSFFYKTNRRSIVLVLFLSLLILGLYNHLVRNQPWRRLPHVQGYYNGLNIDLPSPTGQFPKPRPYNPYSPSEDSNPCFLDVEAKIPVPSVYAYDVVPDDMPVPTLGSYELLGIRDDVCFDRFGRYGPYGLGYSEAIGGIGLGNDTESSGNEQVWSTTGRIDYRTVDWAEAQQRCYTSNEHRYRKAGSRGDALAPAESRPRTAIVVRCYEGFKWTPMAILNFRAMITELSLKTGGEYSVHLLMQVRDTKLPLWAVSSARKQYLNKHVPIELQGLVTLWSESQMKLLYPKKFPRSFRNPSGSSIHSVFRSPHLPLQIFAKEHPEYDFFWNWEMDQMVRFAPSRRPLATQRAILHPSIARILEQLW